MKNPKAQLTLSEDFLYKDRTSIGKYCYGWSGSPKMNFYVGDTRLIIGSFVSFAPGCEIHVGGEHFTDYVTTYPFSAIFPDVPMIPCVGSKGDVVIGSDVWIGQNVTILSGVTIGHGAVIGACSVVAKNVEPYTIVAGNPIREIRKRFTEEQTKKLLELKWWEWDDEQIDRMIPLLMSSDIQVFIHEAEGVKA
jgi:acetyltransferase-like isoleucine patch superfamily enzyme